MPVPEDDLNGQPEGGEENALMKTLREKANRSDELHAENTRMARELAVIRSGIDTDHPLGQFFMANYAGDLADVEAMKAEAQKLGVPLKGATPPPAEGQPPAQPEGQPEGTSMPAEDHGTRDRQTLAQGAPADDGGSTTPRADGIKRAQSALEQGASWEEAAAGLVAHLGRAAHARDPRVIVPDKAIRDVPRA